MKIDVSYAEAGKVHHSKDTHVTDFDLLQVEHGSFHRRSTLINRVDRLRQLPLVHDESFLVVSVWDVDHFDFCMVHVKLDLQGFTIIQVLKVLVVCDMNKKKGYARILNVELMHQIPLYLQTTHSNNNEL